MLYTQIGNVSAHLSDSDLRVFYLVPGAFFCYQLYPACQCACAAQ